MLRPHMDQLWGPRVTRTRFLPATWTQFDEPLVDRELKRLAADAVSSIRLSDSVMKATRLPARLPSSRNWSASVVLPVPGLRILPYVRAWAAGYKEYELVVLGVHTPEFSFEQDVTTFDDPSRRCAASTRSRSISTARSGVASNRYGPALYAVVTGDNVRVKGLNERPSGYDGVTSGAGRLGASVSLFATHDHSRRIGRSAPRHRRLRMVDVRCRWSGNRGRAGRSGWAPSPHDSLALRLWIVGQWRHHEFAALVISEQFEATDGTAIERAGSWL